MLEVKTGAVADFEVIRALSPEDFASPHRQSLLSQRLLESDAWVARLGAEVVGYALRSRFFGHDFLELLFVSQPVRRRGIAAALVRTWESARRTERIFVSTNQSNAPMQSLLEKLGYAASGTVRNLDPGDPELFFVKRFDGVPVEA